ncbi:ATP-binding protein [Streptomyces noursei]|uniref:ATP-binding protein n=1 Tax=Streptomyces TaxID=1883 RepID=UPI0035E05EA5
MTAIRARWSARPWLTLRSRLVAGYVLVATVSALATAGLTYQQARSSLIERGQESLAQSLRGHAGTLAADLPYPPTSHDLNAYAQQLANVTRFAHLTIHYGDLSASAAPDGRSPGDVPIPGPLRRAVAHHERLIVQRISVDDEPWLAAGTPITAADRDMRRLSGLEVYGLTPLAAVQGEVSAVWQAAQRGSIPALVLAVPPALLAARSVLRPVRRLQRGARQLAHGDFTNRLPVTGTDELADLTRTFNESAAALEVSVTELRRMEAAARRFAADVSHELRTPVATMSAVSDLLADGADRLDEDLGTAAQLVSTEADRLARLVEDLMEISRFDAGANTLVVYEIDLAAALQASLDARGWHDEVHLECPANMHTVLDPRRLDVIITNLVGNALRHGAPPVTVTVTATPTSTEPESPPSNRLRIQVVDQGPGLGPDPDQLFERFAKGNPARSSTAGSGLGLAIALENVRLHGGSLTAGNSPQGGAVFTIELPHTTGGPQ